MPEIKERPRVLVSLKGTAQYRRYLDRLRKAVAAKGVQNVETAHQLAAHALAVLGAQNDLVAPRRMPPVGGPRAGSGRPPKPGKKTDKNQKSGVDS